MSELPPPIIDTHVHLDDAAFDPDRSQVLKRARQAGVRGFLNIAYRPDIWEASTRLRVLEPDVKLAAGIHPQDADAFDVSDSDSLAERLLALRPTAIGEAGFDFARSVPSFTTQRMVFQWQIELAISADLPLVIHQRSAGQALAQELDSWPDLRRIIFHSFDGDDRLARWALERDVYVGIGGLACRKNAQAVRDALKLVPTERLLLETDSPYLAPPGPRSRRNEPANLRLVADLLAPLWDLSADQLCSATTGNAVALFGFPFPGGAAGDPVT